MAQALNDYLHCLFRSFVHAVSLASYWYIPLTVKRWVHLYIELLYKTSPYPASGTIGIGSGILKAIILKTANLETEHEQQRQAYS